MTAPRDIALARLRGERADLLIIGGGIVGAGIARDAAMRGLRVALIEQGDFASGTSSKTSKLIHGGLRYLEHGHWRLVFESLRERRILRTIAPGLIHPLSLLLPVYRGDARSAWKIRLGLWLYSLLAAGRNLRSPYMFSPRRALAREPSLRGEGLQAVGCYTDCQMDDARVCLANILQAVSLGAMCCNYVRLRVLLKANQVVCGAIVEDVFTGREFEIRAEAVVNAAGPWSDQIRRLSAADAPPRLAPSKGVHLIVPRVAHEALFVQSRADARMFFVLPWGEGSSLIGTTESPLDGTLETLAANANEVDYLLDEVNRILPSSHLDADDVLATFAGARPLLASARSATRASREHRIEVDRWGLISVMGGKFTTYRLMAKQVVDLLIRERRWTVDRCLTDRVSLLESVPPVSVDHWQAITRALDPERLARLLMRYGAGALHILRLLDLDPALGHSLCPHHEWLEAELVHALRNELACTITDVFARRTPVAWSSCQGLDALSRMTELCQRYAGRSRAEMDRQIEEYHQFLARSLAFRRAGLLSSLAS
ncbi:MAG: glycerol-3-phosphate dehydrogenase/oxidase [Candidatus Omnitrophica bacterium]|nr:glycerol-3-phosphate dehydrogenase/oxidase [Candidatus Omnitrophota bacterium]